MSRSRRVFVVLLTVIVLAGLGIVLFPVGAASSSQRGQAEGEAMPVPVEVVAIERGPIELRRTFSGSLEAMREMTVAAKIGGRIDRVAVDLADEVSNGAEVVVLDGDEQEQAVAQAEAELAVAEANLVQARDAREIAERTMDRQATLRERGVASDAQFDSARAEQLAARSRVVVAEAQLERARSALQSAQIRLGYTRVRAIWDEEDERRVVAERRVEQGDTVAANTSLLTIVALDPIKAVVFVTEADYGLLQSGQLVALRTDAYPGRVFRGTVTRVSPVFESSSRQARVELEVPNPEGLLKPGMFVRVEMVLSRVEDALMVPEVALVRRADRPVVFMLDEELGRVRMVGVETGIVSDGRVQILEDSLAGRVVTLGQQLLDDGSVVVVPGDQSPERSETGE
ncbi:MAG: efflux RND transporter periplasmic adaptor subunit [Phycisphaeraceae bacterium]